MRPFYGQVVDFAVGCLSRYTLHPDRNHVVADSYEVRVVELLESDCYQFSTFCRLWEAYLFLEGPERFAIVDGQLVIAFRPNKLTLYSGHLRPAFSQRGNYAESLQTKVDLYCKPLAGG